MLIQKVTSLKILYLLFFLISACGGGSGNSDIPSNNQPPSLTGSPPTIASEGEIYTFTPNANDPENDTLIFTISNKPQWATFNTTTGLLSGIPDASNIGQDYTGILITVSDGTNNTSLPGFTITVVANTPPVISSSNGIQLPAGTNEVTLTVITNEIATCRYDTDAGTAFRSMPNNFSTSQSTTHVKLITGLSDGNSYQYYVRCIDTAGNFNTNDFLITFFIEIPSTPPPLNQAMIEDNVHSTVISDIPPNAPVSINTNSRYLSFDTNKNLFCRDNTLADHKHADMITIVEKTKLTSHEIHLKDLNETGYYDDFIRCTDPSSSTSLFDTEETSQTPQTHQSVPWSYPAIPETNWAYNPFTITPGKPPEWPTAPKQGYYYIEPNHPLASDIQDKNELAGRYGRFGYPDRPRKTIPLQNNKTRINTAGTVIWLKGGHYTSDELPASWLLQLQGTETNPVWLYGDPLDKPTFSDVHLSVLNSQHMIIDNLQWQGRKTQHSALSFENDQPIHHIVLRNLYFEGFVSSPVGDKAIIEIFHTSNPGHPVHDIVVYRNTFQNNGLGTNWAENKGHQDGFKVTATPTYRVWFIENKALKGDKPDSHDNTHKSLFGDLIHLENHHTARGGIHHIYIAGNYSEHTQHALGATHNITNIIFSSNTCSSVYHGACFKHKNSRSSDLHQKNNHNWWINNSINKSAIGWQYQGSPKALGLNFLLHNRFDNRQYIEHTASSAHPRCASIVLSNAHEDHYIVGNLFQGPCSHIWNQNPYPDHDSEIHIYNNIFTNANRPTDRSIIFSDTPNITVYVENNLFDNDHGHIKIGLGNTRTTLRALNEEPWATTNLIVKPWHINDSDFNFDAQAASATINAGTRTYVTSGAVDVYQQFIRHYGDDPHYPGSPNAHWPRDALNRARIVGQSIDIGPYEFQHAP